MEEKISFFKQKWMRVDRALLAYVRYERMEHVKMTAQKSGGSRSQRVGRIRKVLSVVL